MPNVQIGEERHIGSVGVKVFRLDLPEYVLPQGVREMYTITLLDRYNHASAIAVPVEPTDEIISKAVGIHVRLSQGKTRRN